MADTDPRPVMFVEVDGHGEPTVWAHPDDEDTPPRVVVRRRDLAYPEDWPVVVARLVAAGSDPYA